MGPHVKVFHKGCGVMGFGVGIPVIRRGVLDALGDTATAVCRVRACVAFGWQGSTSKGLKGGQVGVVIADDSLHGLASMNWVPRAF